MIRIEDLDIGANLDVAGPRHARSFLLQHHALHALGVLAERDLLDVEDDARHIFPDARNRGEFVQHAVDMHRGDGAPLQGREQYAAKRIAESKPKAALQRFGDDGSEALRVAARHDVELGGLN